MNRRNWLQLSATASLALLLGACKWRQPPLLRHAAHPWPGYEFVFLARELNLLDPALVKLIETPAATANIRALGSQVIESSSLTLDEVLSARERGIPLTIVSVLDVSMGADVLMAPASVSSLKDLKGLRIGVEHTATGALMLDSALKVAGLTAADIQTVYVTVDEHYEAYTQGLVDAVVTYEPVKSRLAKLGAEVRFSSREIPGMIIDLMAVRSDVMESHAAAIREVVHAHFRALEAWQRDPEKYSALMAARLNLPVDDVVGAFSTLELPDLKQNLSWFEGAEPRILQTARTLGRSMAASGLLKAEPVLDQLADGRFLT